MAASRFPAGGGVACLACAALLAGCGFGAGSASEGNASLLVTRDYGAETIADATVDNPPESETVIRLLDSNAEITTRYGGGFVQSIEGIEGAVADGRSHDWFFYVNGVESEVGAAEAPVRGGDRVWWDYRDWTAAMRVPAVVGSFPEPFLQASSAGEAAEPEPVEVACAGGPNPCEAAAAALREAGADARVVEARAASGDAPAVLVGPWSEIDGEPAARLVAQGPQASGVFVESGAEGLAALDRSGAQARSLAPADGLIAATRVADGPPIWIITGEAPAGVERAAAALDEATLARRYAVVVPSAGGAGDGGEAVALPLDAGEGP